MECLLAVSIIGGAYAWLLCWSFEGIGKESWPKCSMYVMT